MSQMDETLRPHQKLNARTGWAQTGKLTTGQAQPASMQVNFSSAEEITVQIDNQAPGSDITAFATATVTFMIDGNPLVRTFDVAAGVSISCVAEAVHINVKDSTPNTHPQGISYGVLMTAAVMPRPSTASPPVLTGLVPTPVNSGAQTANVPIPNGANGVIVFAFSTSAVVLELTETTADDATVVLQTNVTPGQVTPLVAGAGAVNVINRGTGGATIGIVFTIDG
jgi:hypothetical protein